MTIPTILTILTIFFSLPMVAAVPPPDDARAIDFVVAELNCENLFDCHHDSLKDDRDFLPDGAYRWTPQRYWRKTNNIARAILACGERADGTTASPDLVALCDVENDSVMTALTRRSLLRQARYEYVITHSPDERGIDVALLYSPLTFRLLGSSSIAIPQAEDMRPTRDILHAYGVTITGDTLHVFVVHAPSRSKGVAATRQHRHLVASVLVQHLDTLRQQSPHAAIIVAGDFNDYSGDESLRLLSDHRLTDVSAGARGSHGAEGTYKYQGEWGSLDHIFLSDTLLPSVAECFVADKEFLLTEDTNYGGVQPLRNLYGPKPYNGYSDHLPLVLRLRFNFSELNSSH